MKLELKPSYISPNFGKINRFGEWDIIADTKKYILYVDGVAVINIAVEYERFDKSIPDYLCARVSYDNNFYFKPNSPYLNKGYATYALKQITEMILNEGNVPRIILSIVPENKQSQRVSAKAGYTYIHNNEYSIFHPNAMAMYEKGLQPLKAYDEDIYNYQIKKYRSFIAKTLDNKPNVPQLKK